MSSTISPRVTRALALLLFGLTVVGMAHAEDNWHRLGDTRLSRNSHEATIAVGMDEGWYRWIKLRAVGGRVDIRRVKVVFSSGDKEDFDTFGVLLDGSETRPLPIAGTVKRFVRRIEIVYDISDNAQDVHLKAFGRRSD